MDNTDKGFSEFVSIVKSWIPRRSEPANVSRNFWMPDHSCRVCYECDSQFTVFNRRHHCRLCGRIFCGKCTANFVPVTYFNPKIAKKECERIRVCNFCLKQRGHRTSPADNATQLRFNSSPSPTSLVGTKLSRTFNSTVTARSHSIHIPFGPAPHLAQSCQLEASSDKPVIYRSASNVDAGEIGSHQFGYATNRSDDDDYEYGLLHNSDTQHFQSFDEYGGRDEFNRGDQNCHSNEGHSAEDKINLEDICSTTLNTEFHADLDANKLDENEPDSGYEYNASSSIYDIEHEDAEPVDFENNGLLWLPPDPEDEENEREHIVIDEEEDEPAGEWKCDDGSSNGSSEYQTRDRSSEEHKTAMKNVVDGHFRALIAQLLQVENLPLGVCDRGSWLDIVTSLSWEAANFLKPDTSNSGGMDPGRYVKVKCLACGHPSESKVVRGVVCKKTVAHRRMKSRIEKPRLLILGGALEYQRVTNMLSCFDTLLQQEMDHLKMAVAKIAAHQPSVLLVEKSVSRFAQDFLLTRGISLVLNIKRPFLELITRCTGAEIVPSIDHLSSPMLGNCDLFHVEKYFEDHGTVAQGGKKIQKNLMLFEGCPKPLGCTVLLKGARVDELKKVKHVVQYGVFAAYHLALETSFLADEGAFLPDFPLETPISVGLPDKPSTMDRSTTSVPGLTIPAASEPQGPLSADKKHSSVKKSSHSDYILEAICGASLPYFSTHSNSMPQSCTTKDKSIMPFGECNEAISYNLHDQTVSYDTIGGLDQAGNGTAIAKNPQTDSIEKQTSYCNTETLFQGTDEMHDYIPLKEEAAISSSDDQSILVSVSTRCVWKGTVCERSQIFRFTYYGNFDKPLGRFLRDHLFDEGYRCRSCDMPSEAHVHCYTHRHGSLTISVRKLPDIFLPGERDGKIWMWHRCLMCRRSNGFPPATRRIVMSDAAWSLSFGKFLELSFSNHAAASRVASCGHSLHKDCLRFYGFGRMVACFRYASINVNSVCLPPSKVDFNYELQDWIEKEANEVAEKAESLFREINGALCTAKETLMPNTNTDVPALFRHYMILLEDLLQNEKADFEDALHKALNKDVTKGEPVIDILEVNKLRRQLILHSYFWDRRLLLASEPEDFSKGAPNGFLLRDKEKLCSVEKTKDLNLASKSQKDYCCPNSLPVDYKADEFIYQGMDAAIHPEGLLEPNYINKLSPQVRYIGLDSFHETKGKAPLYSSLSVSENILLLESGLVGRRTLSDGQVPFLTDLSDTFDAMWTGDSGSGLVDGINQDPSVLMENLPAVPISEGAEERTGPDLTQSFTSIFFSKLGDSADDFSSRFGLPFVNMYRSLNRSWGHTPRFNDVSEDSSVFPLLLKELERQGGARFLLTSGKNAAVVLVYDDEPTSVISFALVSPEYYIQLSDDRDRMRDGAGSSPVVPLAEAGNYLTQSFDETYPDPFRSSASFDDNIFASRSSLVSDPLINNKAMHARVSFTYESRSGKVKFTVTCYFAKQFDAIRRACCPSELDFIRSLSRCKKWGAQGGKSNVFFAKSLDDRFIVKQVTKTELESFIKFAQEYFKYLSDSIATGSPTCLAKILGVYQVTSKNIKGGKDIRMDVMVMENLLFRRSITRLYDLKGSSRSRYNPDSSGDNKVLLDQNLIESMPTSPIFVGNKAKRLLERAVWNDTSFLASIDVMDYSLLVGVDEEKNELVLGIIDFIRQYTWDKHLETWVKASGILGGPKNVSPTVISPKQYKRRFRKAMSAYFLVVPDLWSPSAAVPNKLKDEISQENQQGATTEA